MAYDLKKAPLNLKLMNGTRDKIKNLVPVTSTNIHSTSSNQLDPNGLFSADIFHSVGNPDRMKTLSYIDLHTKVMHPLLWRNIERVSSWYTEIFLGRRYAVWDSKMGVFTPSDATTGETGPSFFLEHLPNIKFQRNKSTQRDLRIDVIEKYRNDAIYDYVIVLPAGHRDLEEGRGGNLKCDDINDSYKALIGLSKNIDKIDKDNIFNHRSQGLMQRHFNSIFEQIFNFLKGKGGFTASKWTKRKVEHGTRTILSSMRLHSRDIDGPQRVDINTIHCGLAQLMRGTLPLTINGIAKGFADRCFNSDGTANLIDPKTLKSKVIPVDPKWRDLYTTEDGVLSLIKEFKVDDYKFKEARVQGLPVALIYRDDKGFMIQYSIDDFPESLREGVRPITKFELYYFLLHDVDRKTVAWMTRYPFADENSMFPGKPYLKTTTVGDALYRYDENGLLTKDMYREFPVLDGAPVGTASPHPNRLSGLNGDHDGDTVSLEFSMAAESVREVNAYLDNPLNMIARGGFTSLFSTDIAEWTLSAYTSPKPVAV